MSQYQIPLAASRQRIYNTIEAVSQQLASKLTELNSSIATALTDRVALEAEPFLQPTGPFAQGHARVDKLLGWLNSRLLVIGPMNTGGDIDAYNFTDFLHANLDPPIGTETQLWRLKRALAKSELAIMTVIEPQIAALEAMTAATLTLRIQQAGLIQQTETTEDMIGAVAYLDHFEQGRYDDWAKADSMFHSRVENLVQFARKVVGMQDADVLAFLYGANLLDVRVARQRRIREFFGVV